MIGLVGVTMMEIDGASRLRVPLINTELTTSLAISFKGGYRVVSVWPARRRRSRGSRYVLQQGIHIEFISFRLIEGSLVLVILMPRTAKERPVTFGPNRRRRALGLGAAALSGSDPFHGFDDSWYCGARSVHESSYAYVCCS